MTIAEQQKGNPMSFQDAQPPKYRTILVAGIIFLAILALLWSPSEPVKQAGAPFLYLPSMLGIVQRVTPDELHIVSLAQSPATLELAKPGRYQVFADDVEILSETDQESRAQTLPWLDITALGSGAEVPLAFVERGLRPYDTSLARGRPIFTFAVTAPGSYELRFRERPAKITADPVPPTDGEAAFRQRTASIASVDVVPDYTTGNEAAIQLAYTIQIAALGVLLSALVFYRNWRYHIGMRSRQALQEERRAQFETFWQREIQRAKDEQER